MTFPRPRAGEDETTPRSVRRPAGASARLRRTFTLGLAMSAMLVVVGAGSASAASPPFEPITFKRIPLPKELHGTTTPAFTVDGKHLLFRADREVNGETEKALWITDLKGKDVRCITCSGGPAVPQVNYVFPFPDGKRIFVGFFGVIECSPSVVDCETHDFLPYDLSTVRPAGGVVLPGGAANRPQVFVRQGAYPTLAPDGKHIGYSDVRSDGLEQMVVAKLVRQADKYVAADAKVINPPGPTSATDPSVDAWSESSALHELKTFTHGGRAVTYVQVGGIHAENPDVWEVDLTTGVRKRLTSHPDWDEDFMGSPDGQSLAVWSNRTHHLIDGLGGLLPFRSFIDSPIIGAEAGLLINTPNNIACGGVPWLMPSDGDRGGVIGQPIVPPDVKAHTTTNGMSAWSPDGTMLALNALKDGAGLFSGDTPPFLLVAQFTSRKPTAPEPVVDSDVGSWAPEQTDWHPPFGYVGSVTLNGPGGGTVHITYNGNPGAIFGSFSESYTDYSEDGKTFLNGTRTISVPGFGITKVHDVTHLVMTGEHTGSIDKDLEITGGNASGGSPTYTGSSIVTYDGTTVTGPPSWLNTKGSCPERLPKLPQLKATATSLGKDRYEIKVTASQGGMGPNETVVDTRPVTRAYVQTLGADAYTDNDGVAVIKARGNPHQPTKVTVTAGETLAPTSLEIGP
jgi:hypothetical protein